jgi:hypothetical protein
MSTMPIAAQNSSSSLDPIDLGDHLVDSLYQQTPLININLYGMVLHHMVAVGRDIM